MMPGDQIGENKPPGTQPVDRIEGSGGGVVDPSPPCFDMGFRIVAAGTPDVGLELRAELSQIVPVTGESAPVPTTELRCETLRQPGHPRQMLLELVYFPATFELANVSQGDTTFRTHDRFFSIRARRYTGRF